MSHKLLEMVNLFIFFFVTIHTSTYIKLYNVKICVLLLGNYASLSLLTVGEVKPVSVLIHELSGGPCLKNTLCKSFHRMLYTELHKNLILKHSELVTFIGYLERKQLS